MQRAEEGGTVLEKLLPELAFDLKDVAFCEEPKADLREKFLPSTNVPHSGLDLCFPKHPLPKGPGSAPKELSAAPHESYVLPEPHPSALAGAGALCPIPARLNPACLVQGPGSPASLLCTLSAVVWNVGPSALGPSYWCSAVRTMVL